MLQSLVKQNLCSSQCSFALFWNSKFFHEASRLSLLSIHEQLLILQFEQYVISVHVSNASILILNYFIQKLL